MGQCLTVISWILNTVILFDENLEFNSPESIFELDYDNVNRINHWEFDMGSRTVVATFGEGCYFAGYDVALPTEYAYKSKSEGGIWEEGDLRRDESIRYDFTYLGITPTEVSWGADELAHAIKSMKTNVRTNLTEIWLTNGILVKISLYCVMRMCCCVTPNA